MDIYTYAKQFNADYYDIHTGNTYAIQDITDVLNSDYQQKVLKFMTVTAIY